MNSKIYIICSILFATISISQIYAQPGYAGEWNKTRLYGHSYDSGDFTDEQYDWIRDHFEYFTIEKTHLRAIYGNPSHELTSRLTATKLIEANPRCKPLMIYSLGGAYTGLFESHAEIIESNPDYFLYNDDGEVSSLNPANPEENDWYIETINKNVDNSDLDGIFYDSFKGVHLTYQENAEYMMDRVNGFRLVNGMDFAPNGQTIRNWPESLNYSDGVFIDAFFRRRVMSKEAGVTLIDACMEIPNNQMFVCFSAYDGYSSTYEFSHAAYLIVAHENAYYRWVDEGDHLWGAESLMTWHDDFGKEIGEPLGEAVKNGYVYTRVFEHCTVTLDVENITSSIVWDQNNGSSTTTFTPDPSKTYYIDNPRFNRRLAATGESEEAYTTSTDNTSDDVKWQFVAKGNGSWHVQRAAGGTKPRLRSDNSDSADMQETTSNGGYTYFDMESTGSGNTYFFTLPDGPSNYKRLQVDNNQEVSMVPSSSNGSWESFTITEAGFVSSGSTMVHITKRNATGFAIDGDNGSADFQNIYLYEENDANVNQQWIEIDRGNGYYSYQKQGTDFCIDGGNSGAKGQDVYLFSCGVNNYNQHWQKIDAGGGAYKLIKRNASDFAINGGNDGANEQDVNLWNSTSTSENLHWYITPIGTSAKSTEEISLTNDSDVIIYPNPVVSSVTIQRAANSIIYVYDINGRELITKEILTDIEKLDLSSLSIGVYYIQVKGIQSISVIKIIKE